MNLTFPYYDSSVASSTYLQTSNMRKTSNVNHYRKTNSWTLSQLLCKYHGLVSGTGILRDNNDNSNQNNVFVKSENVS